jgi:hypothetical protein
VIRRMDQLVMRSIRSCYRLGRISRGHRVIRNRSSCPDVSFESERSRSCT